MNADSTINIGSTHSICQDYVIARDRYVILSDGCSSSPDTDIGARLLVKALDQCLRKPGDIEELHKEAACIALDWANMIALPPQSVDATLMSIHVTNNDLIIACSGDGVIILESQAGVLDMYAISSPSGYPFYPSYVHQPDRLSELVTNDRHTKTIKDFRSNTLTTSDSLTITFKLNVADYKYAAVASDGMNSFIHTQQPVRLPDVLNEFWTFKNSHGSFVERRMKRFKKDTQSKGWQHVDDLAIGVIHLGEDPRLDTDRVQVGSDFLKQSLGEEHVRQSSQNILEG